MKKRLFALTTCLVILAAFPANAIEVKGVPDPINLGYVVDMSDPPLLKQQEAIKEEIADIKKLGIQTAVFIVPDLAPSNSIEDFSVDLGNQYGIGGKGGNGAMIILSVKERKSRFEIGYNTSTFIGAQEDLLNRYGTPLFKQKKFDEGVLAILKQVEQRAAAKANGVAVNSGEEGDDSIMALLGLFILLFAGYCLYRISSFGSRIWRSRDSNPREKDSKNPESSSSRPSEYPSGSTNFPPVTPRVGVTGLAPDPDRQSFANTTMRRPLTGAYGGAPDVSVRSSSASTTKSKQKPTKSKQKPTKSKQKPTESKQKPTESKSKTTSSWRPFDSYWWSSGSSSSSDSFGGDGNSGDW